MKKIMYLWLFYLMPCGLFGQDNLLPNPGFEEYIGCINNQSNDSVRMTHHWSNLIDTTMQPDSLCSEGWAPYLKVQEAFKGEAAQYILTFYGIPGNSAVNFRIYILAKLKKPLVKDNVYFFRMKTRCVYNTLVGFAMTNNQGVAFSKTVPKIPDDKGALNIEAAIQSDKIIDTSWNEITGCFKANGGEQYAIFGNFKPNNTTLIKNLTNQTVQVDPLNPFGSRPTALIGSYLVDDVELLNLFANLPQDTAICEGETLNLNAGNNLRATYKWQDGSTSPQYRITKSGTYSVKIGYTIDNHTCSIEQFIKVRVLPKSKTTEHIDTVVCSYKDVLLKVGTGRSDDTIQWSDNSIKDTLRITKKGYYEARIANACGKYAQSFDVKFANCIIDIYVPNAFSPNGDNNNDTFVPFVHAEFPIIEYEFGVYNRWGIEVFSSKERGASWDGLFKNQPSENGIYVWYLKVKGQVGNKVVQKIEGGDVTLMR
jgi:gliding motility-associated-like protein